MPRYCFSLKIGDRCLDGGGIELADDTAALAHAWQIGRVLLRLPDRSDDWAEGILIIEAADGGDSFALPLSDVAAGRCRARAH
ncbi:DUF6894 family protein [Methylobacterium nonmethylotrophicum]|uniref:DUF6894 family protein n=1 Tax=Methylobacterium nonmethylotrophicum TaxID=1141884 RepID=UPI003CCAC79F